MTSREIKIPSENPSCYCRLCFSDRNLVALFSVDADPHQFLLDQITQCTGIRLNPTEDISCSICWRCAVALEDFQLFKQRSLAHDAIIRTKYANAFTTGPPRDEQENSEWFSSSFLETGYSDTPQHEENLILETPSLSSKVSSRPKMDFNQVVEEGTAVSELVDGTKNEPKLESQRTFTCHLCRTEFDTQPFLWAHFKDHHSDLGRPHVCTICTAAFQRKHHLDQHLASHSGEMKYSCNDCGAQFMKNKSLKRHRQIYHSLVPFPTIRNNSIGGQFKCSYCSKSFKHRPSLNFHVKSHYEMLPCVCEVCDARFANEKGKEIHKGKFHPNESVRKSPTPKPLLECAHCPRFFEQRNHLTQHIKHIHPTLWAQCGTEEQDMQAETPCTEGQTPEDSEMQLATIKTEVDDIDLSKEMGIEF